MTESSITTIDIAAFAKGLGIDPALLAAVLEVECDWPKRSGVVNGKPRILWERHICWREAKESERRRLPVTVCSPKPGYYARTQEQNWKRLEAAKKVIGERAWLCASYGLPQIMGFNHRLAGYATAHSMADAFKDEREQVRAFGRFLRRSGLLAKLKRRDWRGFARGYNGPKYYKHRYNERLARAYWKWERTEWPRVSVARKATETIHHRKSVAQAWGSFVFAAGALAIAAWQQAQEYVWAAAAIAGAGILVWAFAKVYWKWERSHA